MDVSLLNNWGRVWWIVLLRGLAAIAFGLLAWTTPGLTILSLVLLWGAYALVDGVAALVAGWKAKGGSQPVWHIILVGVVGIAAGLFTFVSPGLTELALLMLIAAWAAITGLFQIVAAIRLRKDIANEWYLILSGVLSLVFGVLMFVNPGAGAIALLWVIAAFSVAFGALLVGFAFQLRKHASTAANNTH